MAEFGTPETWNMKVGDFIETQLPQEKPQALLDLQEQNRKQRLLDALQKIGPGLMDESLNFIRREELARGSGRGSGNQFQKSSKRLFIEKNLDKIKKDYIAGDSIPMLTKKYLKKSGTDATLEQVLRDSVTKSEMKKRKASPTYGLKGMYGFPTEKLIKIKNDYLKLIEDGLKKEDLSGIKPFTNYLEQNYPDDVNTIGSAFNKRGIKKPGKEDLFKARNILAKKLIVNPNLTLQDVLKKLTSNKKIGSLNQVVGLDVDALPEPKIKPPQRGGQFGAPAKKLEADVAKLLKSKTITDKLKAGKFPTITDVSRVLKTDLTAAEGRLADLAQRIEESNFSNKIKNVATNYLETRPETRGKGGKRARTIYERRFSKMMELDSLLPTIRKNILRKIENFIPQLEGIINVDEVGGLTSSMRRGSGPYAIFGQVLGSDFNQSKKAFDIDKIKSIAQRKLNDLPVDSPERTKIIEEYNAEVDRFETEANKNNPAKKVKGQKISVKPPSETIKNKKVYKQYKDLFDDHFKEYGYSLEVDANTDSIPDIEKKLDNKSFQNTVKNRFSKLIGKGGRLGAVAGLATLAGTGFALADEPGFEDEDDSILPEAAVGAAAVAPLATKKGRSIYGKAGKGLLKTLKVLGQPSVAAGFAADELRQGNIKTAGASLLAPELVGSLAPAGRGILSTIGRIAANPFGKAARAFTPVGLATIGAGALKDVYDEYERRQALTPEERLEEDIERDRAADEMMVGAAEGGRIGFADGPDDPSKRTFMKIMAGIASLPVVGKFFKAGKPVVKKLANTTTKMPDWFPDFVDRFIGRSVGKKVDADLMEYKSTELPGVTLTKGDDGQIVVEGKNAYDEPYEIVYRPPGYELVDETTGKAVKTPGEFIASDTQFRRTGPEMDDYDVDGVVVNDVDDILGGNATELEGFATGTGKSKYTRGQKEIDMADAQGTRADVDEGPDIDMSDYED